MSYVGVPLITMQFARTTLPATRSRRDINSLINVKY